MSSTKAIFSRAQPKFDAVVQAVRYGDLKAVDNYLNKNPELLEQCDEKGMTLIHHALATNFPEILRHIHKHLQKRNKTDLLLKKNEKDGSTPMHWAAENATYSMLFAFVDLIEPHLLHAAVTAMDNIGRNSLHYTEFGSKRDLLLPHAMKNTLGPFNKVVNRQEVLQRYAEEQKKDMTGQLEKNLNHGLRLLEEVGRDIPSTDAHPEMYEPSRSEIRKLNSKKVIAMRSEEKEERIRIKARYKDKNTDEDKIALRNELLDSSYKIIKKYGAGNCIDMVIYAMRMSCHLAPAIRCEPFQVLNSDHAFMVLGRSRTPHSPSCYSQWGETAVVLCFLSRKICLAREIPFELNYWERTREGCVVMGALNFNYHSVDLDDLDDISDFSFEPKVVEVATVFQEKKSAEQEKLTKSKIGLADKSDKIHIPKSLMAIRSHKSKDPDVIGFRSFLMMP